MTDTTYEAIVEAVQRDRRRHPEPHAAAQAMIRAVGVLMQSRSRPEIEALAADMTTWDEAVRMHVRAGPAGGNDVLLSRRILPLLFDAAEADSINETAPARPRGKHFTAKLAAIRAA